MTAAGASPPTGDANRTRRRPAIAPWEWLGFGAVILVAAAVRLVGLAGRGTWDADQGHDMLVLRAFVVDGQIPLVGPPTSIGTFHHGALYYDLLAPAAWLSGADPVVVVAEIALGGVLAVGLVWWLARAIAGPVAAIAAAGLIAISATAIDASTFIWNPNLIAASSALLFCAEWQAWRSRQPRWWLLAAAALAVTMQLHVLGSVLAVPTAAFFLVDLRRRPAGERGAVLRWGAGGLALIAASYVPLLVYDLGHDFAETRGIVGFFLSPEGAHSGLDPVSRLIFGTLRILAWPLAGLITNAPLPGILAAVSALAVLAWWPLRAHGEERVAARWLVATLGFSIVVLALAVGGLSLVTPLPNDHYHAFLDPPVFVAAGVAAAALWARGLPGRVLAGAGLAALVAWNVATWPPATAVDGGWPAAESAAARLQRDTPGLTLALVSLPSFKTAEAYAFPLVRDGDPPVGPSRAGAVVVLCDALFVHDCGGPAEAVAVADLGVLRLVDRFAPAPGRTLSVYLRGEP